LIGRQDRSPARSRRLRMTNETHSVPIVPKRRLGFLMVMGVMAAIMTMVVGPSVSAGQEQLPDEGISRAIQSAFLDDSAIDSESLTVEVREGIVTLEGTVGNLLARERSQRIAETIRGVRSVVNLIEVQHAEGRSDHEIREDVEEALLADPATYSFRVFSEVEDGIVTLSGTVNSAAERRLAESVAKSVRGVRGLLSQIVVDPPDLRGDREIEREIQQVLRWDILVDDALLAVHVDRGEVVLSGVVGSAAEKGRARLNAWVPGVRSVDATYISVADWLRDEDLQRGKFVPVPDHEIEEAIQRALFLDPRVLESDVFIEAEHGVVTLEGTVPTLRARRGAEQVAWSTVGVVSVHNELEVEPAALHSDAHISLRVSEAMERDALVEADDITISVAAGIVTLMGSVDSYFQRAQADLIASRVAGVLEVHNFLEVTDESAPLLYDPFIQDFDPAAFPWYHFEPVPTRASDEAIKESIEERLFWSPYVENSLVRVTVEDGVATLRGTVTSLREKWAATASAFRGGAVRVNNLLVIPR
jgi:osmotically-inducible protein OsmY